MGVDRVSEREEYVCVSVCDYALHVIDVLIITYCFLFLVAL